MKKFNWVKIRALELDYKLKDLANQSEYSYDYFIQILNGFKKAPKDFEEKVKKIFVKWSKELEGNTVE